MLVKMPGLRSWIFSGKKFEDSLIFRIKRGGGTRGVGACHNFVTLTGKKRGQVRKAKEMKIYYVPDNIIFIYPYNSPNVDSKDF